MTLKPRLSPISSLRAAGYRVRRYSGAQIEAEPERIMGDLRRALAPHASTPS